MVHWVVKFAKRDSSLVEYPHSQEMFSENMARIRPGSERQRYSVQNMSASVTTNLEALSVFDLNAWAWHKDLKPEAFQQVMLELSAVLQLRALVK